MPSNPMAQKAANKQAWADIDEEEDNENTVVQTGSSKQDEQYGGKYVISRVQRPVERTAADGTKERVDQTFLVKKWVFPVRRQVLERKKLAKFGDVKDVPKGEHKPGDYQLDAPVSIDKAEQEGEIGIVSQLENLTTTQVLEKMGTRDQEKPQEKAEEKKDKWAAAFAGSVGVRRDFTLRIINVISYESSIEDIDHDLQNFFSILLEKSGVKYRRLKVLTSRDNAPRFLNKILLTFNDKESAEKALGIIDGATFNDTILEAGWSEPRKTK